MQNLQNEVNVIRKYILLFFILMMMAPVCAQAREAGTVAVSSGSLNVRTGPSTASKKVASLYKGRYVTILEKTGDWFLVEYEKGRTGYCHGAYIQLQQSSNASVQTQSGSLNVRSGPGTSYGRLVQLRKGEEVLVLSQSGGWSRILYHGSQTGYVSSQYLSVGFPAVTIQVPDLKQQDSRWADVQIGTSGKTIAQIGCTTTAIAMLESVRQGRVIFPDAMSRELRYTPSGNVYWPADYKVTTTEAGYLERVYQLLRQGKPVLLGMRNTAGSQHWVVIYGYQGGKTLSPDRFLIRDPGTYSRTTLQQFLSAYPAFYKYFNW